VLYLYVIDALCKRLGYSLLFEPIIVILFKHAFELAMEATKEKLARLAESWNVVFQPDTLERIKEIIDPPPPEIVTPTRSPEHSSFDLNMANDLLI
jgi:hypothetical protein